MRPLAHAVGFVLLSCASAAGAESYARPPDGYWNEPPVAEPPTSTVRVDVGPAIRVGPGSPLGGLATAIDIGARAAGARFSGSWFRAGSDRGLSQYTAELWIDF